MKNSSHLHAGQSGTDTNKPVGIANRFKTTGGADPITRVPCLRCGLPLRNSKSVARRRGPTCYRIHKQAQAAQQAQLFDCSCETTTELTVTAEIGGQR